MQNESVPQVFVSYAHDSNEHKRKVVQLAEFLRTAIGLDVRLDRWDDNRRRDWASWANENLRSADYIMVVASPLLRLRTESGSPRDEGRGARFEAGIILDLMTQDQVKWTERILPVVLKGGSVDDVPTFLNPYSTTRFHIDEVSEAGIADLVAAITGQGEVPMPTRGVWRNGLAEPLEHRSVLLAGLPPLTKSPDISAEGAWIDDVYYSESLVLRRPPAGPPTRSFIEVDLGRAYRRMTSVIGVPDGTAEAFQVAYVQAHLDGRPRPEIGVSLGMPGELDLDVTGVRRLRLEMYRPEVAGSPSHGGPRSRRPSRRGLELVWGNPVLV